MKYQIIYILALLFATMQTFAQTYTYDSNNRLMEVKYSNGIKVTYTYDAVGNRLTKNVTGATAETFTISVAVLPVGSGKVTGGGTYSDGTSVELQAIANAGYEFSKWSDNETDNPRTIKVDRNQAFTAIFIESSTPPSMAGDLNADGKVNNYDLNLLVDAYLSNANATIVTDFDSDSKLSIADITELVGIINDSNSPVNNNGHQYVDLGLPSGALWATCNVGASNPEEAGGLFAWGETDTKTNYTWSTYKWCNGDDCSSTAKSLTKYCDREGYGKADGKMSLELEDDVAHVKWGGDWHIPTEAELQELVDNCTVEEITIDAGSVTKAFKFTGSNGNSIILPFAGYWNGDTYRSNKFYYWTTDIKNKYCTQAFHLQSSKSMAGGYRYRGFSVRPVLSEYTPVVRPIVAPTSYLNHALVDLGLPSGTLWATCNLGASSPGGYGCHYSWGETESSCEGKVFSEESYKYYSPSGMTKYTEAGVLDSSDDAATVEWGGAWRMPTLTEVKELANSDYTTQEWTTENGVYGIRITSIVEGYEGNSIFLPAAGQYRNEQPKNVGEQGFYWASSIHEITTGDYPFPSGDCMRLGDGGLSTGAAARWRGHSIRPVVSLNAINK